MEKKKELTDKEDNLKGRAKTKLKNLEESRKKREDKKGNQPSAELMMELTFKKTAHQTERTEAEATEESKADSIRNFGRGFNKNFEVPFSHNNMGRGHPGRGFDYRGPGGRLDFQVTNFRRGRGHPQEQFYQHKHSTSKSDNSTLGTNQSSTYSNWENNSNENFYNHHQSPGYCYHHY